MPLVRFARIALAIAIVFSLLFMTTLPFPPVSPHERMTYVIFGTLLLLEVLCIAMLASRRLLPQIVMYVLGTYGLLVFVSHSWMMAHGEFGEAPLKSLVFVLAQALALAVAAAMTLADTRRGRARAA